MTLWLYSLYNHLFPRGRVTLGEAKRLDGDVVISFRGQGRARFRLQHTRDEHGKPWEFGWCDVSAVSNAIRDPRLSIRDQSVPGGVLVDYVDGNRDVPYRRHRAAWLRIVPFDDDVATRRQCARYSLQLRPVP